MNFCLIARCRNERNIIEWVDYHLSIGITYIVIYDDFSDPPIKNILGDRANVYVVTNDKRVPVDPMYGGSMCGYHKIFPKIDDLNLKIDYIIDLDIDEYLFIGTKFNNITEFINYYTPFDILLMNWFLIGNDGKISRQTDGLLQNFNKSDDQFSEWGKSIAKYSSIQHNKSSPHIFELFVPDIQIICKNLLNETCDNNIPFTPEFNQKLNKHIRVNENNEITQLPPCIFHYAIQDIETFIKKPNNIQCQIVNGVKYDHVLWESEPITIDDISNETEFIQKLLNKNYTKTFNYYTNYNKYILLNNLLTDHFNKTHTMEQNTRSTEQDNTDANIIINHPSYEKSYQLFQEIAKNMKTFHYHPHILFVLRELLGSDRKTFMEIGSYYGASSSLILSSDKPTNIIALDTFELDPHHQRQFMDNTFKYYKPIHRMTPIMGDSQTNESINKVRNILNGQEIDLFFIDGNHRYRPVVHDFLNYHNFVSKGGYIVFDDYQDTDYSPEVKTAVHWVVKLFKPWYNIIGSIPNKINAYGGKYGSEIMKKYYNNFILQKKKEDVHINFGIIMATYYRKDGSTLAKIKRAIDSINKQTYQHWTLILVGDKYENTEEFNEIIQLVDPNKIIYKNLDQAHERSLFEENKINTTQLWNNAGANAMSKGLDMSLEAGFSHVAHLDDDDFWEPNHLDELNNTYMAFPETIFAYTCGRFLNTTIPKHNKDITWTYGNLPPRGRNLLHSSVSWRVDIMDLRYPTIDFDSDDLNLVLNTPADALMWERVHQYMWKHQYAHVYIPKITVNHLEEGASYF